MEKNKKHLLENKIIKNILSLSKRGKMYIKINTLENENETLKNTIKNELYKTFIDKLGEPLEVKRLHDENKKLRKKIKIYKEMLKEDKPKKRRKK